MRSSSVDAHGWSYQKRCLRAGSAVSQQQRWQGPRMQGMLWGALLRSWGWPMASAPGKLALGFVAFEVFSLGRCHRPGSTGRFCLGVTVGSHWPASLIFCQLPSCSVSSSEVGFHFYLLHYIKYSNLKKIQNPTTPEDISREQYFLFAPAGQGPWPFSPWCSSFHFELRCSWVSPGYRSLPKTGASWAWFTGHLLAPLQGKCIQIHWPYSLSLELVVQLKIGFWVILLCNPIPAGRHASTSHSNKKI